MKREEGLFKIDAIWKWILVFNIITQYTFKKYAFVKWCRGQNGTSSKSRSFILTYKSQGHIDLLLTLTRVDFQNFAAGVLCLLDDFEQVYGSDSWRVRLHCVKVRMDMCGQWPKC